jgi:hypothetical protein
MPFRGLRGGWGGITEIWKFEDGTCLFASFRYHVGRNSKMVKINTRQTFTVNGDYTPPERPQWFNSLTLMDAKRKTLYSAEKLPYVLQ